MDIPYRCAAMKERVAAELQESLDARERSELLVAAFYEMSRSILPELGHPRKSPEYLKGQGAALELISFIARLLIRNSVQEGCGIAVFAEIAEGCLDPVLKRKLAAYAQELRNKPRPSSQSWARSSRVLWLLGMVAFAFLYLCLVLPRGVATPRTPAEPAQEAYRATTPPPASPAATGPAAEPGPVHASLTAEPAPRPFPEGNAGIQPTEQATKVRIVNNQVLVPVTLKNGVETIRLELVLDTGATCTSIHEEIAPRLGLDLSSAELTLSEVADGRTISSRRVTVESLSVGPFTVPSAAVELIPFKGDAPSHSGLLGMDFLGKHRYQIDMERELIRWF